MLQEPLLDSTVALPVQEVAAGTASTRARPAAGGLARRKNSSDLFGSRGPNGSAGKLVRIRGPQHGPQPFVSGLATPGEIRDHREFENVSVVLLFVGSLLAENPPDF